MFKRLLLFIFLFFFIALPVQADLDFYKIIPGKIFLQVQKNGEAWYVNPGDLKKYYLNRPSDAFFTMKLFGTGITNKNLQKIPIGIIESQMNDSDSDGLTDNLEKALGTNPQIADSDSDGHNDKTEIVNNYNPAGSSKIFIDKNFAKLWTGKFLLQVESLGQCWYVNPKDGKRYFLGSPLEAFNVMKKLGIGISNTDLEKIETGYYYNLPAKPTNTDASSANSNEVIYKAAEAIRNNNTNTVISYYTKSMEPIIKYTMGFLTSEGRFIWSEMLTGSTLLSSTDNEKVYHNYVYFQGEKIEIKYYVKKQTDGSWKITNL